MGGRGSMSGLARTSSAIENRKNYVLNPTTKGDYISRLEVIAANGQPGYKTQVSMSEWENYGKSRTYFKLNMYRESDGKFHHSQDYGYYDNKSDKYVATKKTSLSGVLNTASGRKMSDSELNAAIKKIHDAEIKKVK